MPGAFAKARMKAREDATALRSTASARAAARIGGVVGRAEAALREPLKDKAIRLAGGGMRNKKPRKHGSGFLKRTGKAVSRVSGALNRAGKKFDRKAREFDNQGVGVRGSSSPLGGSLGASIFGADKPSTPKKQKSVTIKFN